MSFLKIVTDPWGENRWCHLDSRPPIPVWTVFGSGSKLGSDQSYEERNQKVPYSRLKSFSGSYLNRTMDDICNIKAMAIQQLKVLNALDVARIQRYHVNVFLLTGLGFFTAAYDLFCIAFVTKLLGRIYYRVEGASKPGILPRNVLAAINVVTHCGVFCGQIFFGCLGDMLGRKKTYGITLILMVVFSVASGLSFGNCPKAVMATLCFFRFWLGLGVGGVYPLSATIMSEYANRRTRGKYIAAVFAMQGAGHLFAEVVALIVASAFDQAFKAPSNFDDPINKTVPQADYVWRIILMFGAFPAAFTYFWLKTVPETACYTALVKGDADQAAADMSKLLHSDIEAEDQENVKKLTENHKSSFGLFSKEFLKRHGPHLLVTSSTWFLLNIAFYSQNLFQKDILSSMRWILSARRMNAMEEVNNTAKAQLYLTLCATIPGLLFTVKFIDILGRLRIQLIGFFFMTVFMFFLAIPYHYWTENPNRTAFLRLYSLTFFFASLPNVTTFVLPAETFPARLRSTCHGISAATGRLGAIVGVFGFSYAAQAPDGRGFQGYPTGIGVRQTLIVLAFVNLLATLVSGSFSFLKIDPSRLPEPKRRSLEEFTGEINEEFDETEQQASSAESMSDFAENLVDVFVNLNNDAHLIVEL
ncbi:hypothetical protein DITRI_Ditri15bG0097600 [Diplodiscus trichospermus]